MPVPAIIDTPFPLPDEADWRALAEKALAGAGFDALRGRTRDGIAIEPLYREPDFPSAADAHGFPGAAPYARGALRPAERPWDLRAWIAASDGASANDAILAELEGGAGSIALDALPAAELPDALRGVLLDLAAVSLDGTPEAARALAGLAAGTATSHAFNLDPGSPAARALLPELASLCPSATLIAADARAAHEAGGSQAQEIGAAISAGIAGLRVLLDAGIPAETAAQRILFRLSVDTDVMLEAAKLRALRLCWGRVCEAAGAGARGATIEAWTSARMMTRRDPWTNILRVTAAVFAGVMGGAETIVALPFTHALGPPTAQARRLARNTQHVLMLEARAGRVSDPLGGAWYVERMTRALAESGWAFMRQIQAEGGYEAALSSDWVESQIALMRDRRRKSFAVRKEIITGVTDFPLLNAPSPEVAGPQANARTSAARLAPIRWAEPFETLAERGEAAQARVFFANLGSLAEFGARAQFARSLFAIGGVDAVKPDAVHAGSEALAAAFAKSGTHVAVLCGSDDRCAAEGAAVAQALKAAGCDWLVHSGALAPDAPLRTAGVDQAIFAGVDVLHALETLHAALGVKSETRA